MTPTATAESIKRTVIESDTGRILTYAQCAYEANRIVAEYLRHGRNVHHREYRSDDPKRAMCQAY